MRRILTLKGSNIKQVILKFLFLYSWQWKMNAPHKSGRKKKVCVSNFISGEQNTYIEPKDENFTFQTKVLKVPVLLQIRNLALNEFAQNLTHSNIVEICEKYCGINFTKVAYFSVDIFLDCFHPCFLPGVLLHSENFSIQLVSELEAVLCTLAFRHNSVTSSHTINCLQNVSVSHCSWHILWIACWNLSSHLGRILQRGKFPEHITQASR